MKNITIDILIWFFVFILFIAYFGIREQVPLEYSLINELEITEQNMEAGNWNEAYESSQRVKDEWDRVKGLTILNYGEGNVAAMEEYLCVLVGAAKDKDASSTKASVLYIRYLWGNMSKIVPQP